MVRGERAGEAVVRFTGAGLGSADRALEVALLRAIAGAAGLAELAAMLTGLAVARRINRPVEKIIAVTRAMGREQRAARPGPITGPGELRELAAAFDQMADTMDRQEQLRRDLVADVAHELRTPVAVLQAGHEALLDGFAEPPRTSWPRCAMRCCDWRTWSPTCRTVRLRRRPGHDRDRGRWHPGRADRCRHRAGIPADELPRVFDRFWRGRQATQTSGSGIGLAVAAELTLAHGGRLSAASPPGQGTRMTLTLPTPDVRGHGGGDDAPPGTLRESHRTGSVL